MLCRVDEEYEIVIQMLHEVNTKLWTLLFLSFITIVPNLLYYREYSHSVTHLFNGFMYVLQTLFLVIVILLFLHFYFILINALLELSYIEAGPQEEINRKEENYIYPSKALLKLYPKS